MIETAKGKLSFTDLEHLVLQSLSSASFPISPSQVSCLLRGKNLMILVHYPEPALPFPQRVFRLIRDTLNSLDILEQYNILLYIVVEGENQPDLRTSEVYTSDVLEADFSIKAPLHISLSPIEKVSWLLGSINSSKENKHFKYGLLFAIATGCGLITLLTIAYALSRPCVLGKCEIITQASQPAEKIEQLLTSRVSHRAIVQTKSQLMTSLAQLKSIPPWSTYHQEAQNQVLVYQDKLAHLELLGDSLALSQQASSLSENSPLSIAEWQAIVQLGEEAIASAQQIPSDSEFYPQAKSLVQEYQANLRSVEQQLELEQQAFISFQQARQAAELGEVRQSIAQSSSNWQLVEATWQTAIIRLKEIPPTTTFYEQSQELLQSYLMRIGKVQKRQQEEKMAENFYNQGLNSAELAKNAVAVNKWSTAVSHWRNALNFLQQIPEHTFIYREANVLINSFRESLDTTQFRQIIVADLQKTCSGTIKICDFIITNDLIIVNLNSTYTQELWNMGLTAKIEKNPQIEQDILAHIASLEQNFQIISNNSQLILEVYNPQGELLSTYVPQ